jgi:hypothetical protein
MNECKLDYEDSLHLAVATRTGAQEICFIEGDRNPSSKQDSRHTSYQSSLSAAGNDPNRLFGHLLTSIAFFVAFIEAKNLG